jgi:hypothetical protein
MYDSTLRRYLPSQKIIVLAGVILVGFAGYVIFANQSIFSSSSQAVDSTNKTATERGSFLAGKEKPTGTVAVIGTGAADRSGNTGTSSNLTTKTAASVAPHTLAFAAAQQNGEDISDQDIERVAESVSANVSLANPRQYTDGDLTTTASNQQAIKTYVNNLTGIMAEQMSASDRQGPLAIIGSQLQDEGSTNLDEIDVYIENNQQLIDQLLALEVPKSYVSLHKDLINNLSAANTNLKRIKQINTDPTMAAIGIQRYRQISNQSIDLSDRIAEKINQDL